MSDHITGLAVGKGRGWRHIFPKRYTCIAHDETGSTRCEKWIVWMGRVWRHRVIWTMSKIDG